jgi:hypothetical protein
MGIRRSRPVLVAVLGAVLSVAPFAASLVLAAGPGGGACQLQGVASITPPLTNASGNFAYSFTGDLGSCQSNVAGAPTSGTTPSTATSPCSRPASSRPPRSRSARRLPTKTA